LSTPEPLIWLAIAVCVSQSAVLSGLNLAVFSLSRLRLEVAAGGGNQLANAVITLRRDSNFTLATILWANVSVNVLLTLLAESVLAGVGAFLFSTVVITFIGEVLPQAYFRHYALVVASFLLSHLTVQPQRVGDDVIDEDLILLWSDTERRIVTGSDILGRLLRRIARAYPVDTAHR
jgi:metal transporter CNNM